VRGALVVASATLLLIAACRRPDEIVSIPAPSASSASAAPSTAVAPSAPPSASAKSSP